MIFRKLQFYSLQYTVYSITVYSIQYYSITVLQYYNITDQAKAKCMHVTILVVKTH